MAKKKQLSVLGQFLETVKVHDLLPQGSSVLVAVSGGADSVCLFDLVRTVAPRFGLTLVGFHMNHQLRPGADSDERFVRGLFERAGVEAAVVRHDVAAYARRHKLGVEEAGRELRYAEMSRAALKHKCSRVCLGHNANDNLETMLLNLVRGTGVSGLSGIPVRRGIFVRPMIDIERADILRYLGSRGLTWVEDESNASTEFSRNFLRLELVPKLVELNPAAVRNARRAAELVSEEDSYLDTLAAAALRRVAKHRKERVLVDIRRFVSYNIVLKRRMLKQLDLGLDSSAISRVLNACAPEFRGAIKLSGSVRLTRKGHTLELEVLNG